jgi:hypothetical protein
MSRLVISGVLTAVSMAFGAPALQTCMAGVDALK